MLACTNFGCLNCLANKAEKNCTHICRAPNMTTCTSLSHIAFLQCCWSCVIRKGKQLFISEERSSSEVSTIVTLSKTLISLPKSNLQMSSALLTPSGQFPALPVSSCTSEFRKHSSHIESCLHVSMSWNTLSITFHLSLWLALPFVDYQSRASMPPSSINSFFFSSTLSVVLASFWQ